MTRRFFVEPGQLSGGGVVIEGPLAHRLAKVLRLGAGDDIVLFDGSGVDLRVRLEAVSDRRVTAAAIERLPGPREAPTSVHLFQSITKGERFEWLLEKATELGVASITPLVAARAVVRTGGEGREPEQKDAAHGTSFPGCDTSRLRISKSPRRGSIFGRGPICTGSARASKGFC